MINIRPVSDLRNKYPEIEHMVVDEGETVYLTKNGYESMVVISLEKYDKLISSIECKLDEADRVAESTTERYTADEVFAKVRNKMDKK